jgi:hypothetical protein
MYSRRILFGWAIFTVVCLVLFVLVPVSSGALAATGGPQTALRAWQWAVATLASIALAASLILCLLPCAAVALSHALPERDFNHSNCIVVGRVLRC